MDGMKKVKDFMNRKVITIKPSDSIFDAAKVFSELGISGAPVVYRKKVVGVISETDIIKFMSMKLSDVMELPPKMMQQSLSMLCIGLIRVGREHLGLKKEIDRLSRTRVKDVMSKEAVSIGPDANVFDAAAIMQRHDVNRLPVVRKGKLVGLIARADLIRALIE